MSDFSKLCALVVDDNAHMRLILRTILRGLGFGRVEEARDAGDMFEKLGSAPVDMVMIDINMPILDGLELTRMIRTAKDSPRPQVPIIICSSHTERSRVETAIKLGANDFIAKPVSAHTVLLSVNRVVSRIKNSQSDTNSTWEFG